MTTADIIAYLRSTERHLLLDEKREKDEFRHDLIVEERKALHAAAERLENARSAVLEECIDALRPEYPDAVQALQMRMTQEG